MLIIKNRILKSEQANWQEFKFIQQKDFKDLDEQSSKKLRESITKNDFVESFKVWQNPQDGVLYCLDGYHRVKILKELLEDGYDIPQTFQTDFLECENKEQAAKLVLIYSSAYAKITQEGLHNFLGENNLDFLEFKNEIDLVDFSEARFEQKFDLYDTESIQEEEPEILENEQILVSLGDLFQLGKHRLICGSCLDGPTVALLMNGRKARIAFTDPPYNLPANEFTNKGVVKHKDFAQGGGEMSEEEFATWLSKVMIALCQNSIDGALHYICMDWRHCWHMAEASKIAYGDVIPKQIIVWNKNNGANGSIYRAKHEFVFLYKYGTAKHLSHLELQDKVRYNVWDYPTSTAFNNPDRAELQNHPTPKPVKMVADAILDTTNEKDLVIDFFLGSGTTIMAAQEVNRVCYGTEIEPKYCQSIIKRWLKLCKKNGIEADFMHLNGELSVQDFQESEVVA